jgi:hypothetical protein
MFVIKSEPVAVLERDKEESFGVNVLAFLLSLTPTPVKSKQKRRYEITYVPSSRVTNAL